MLVTLNDVLKDAKEKKYGVGLFNTVNLEMAKGVLAAAEELRAPVVGVPLVLHGGSGLSDDDFRNTIKNGISKVNIFTDINVAYAKYIHDNWTDGLGHTKLMIGATEAVKQVVMNKIKLFGSDGKY